MSRIAFDEAMMAGFNQCKLKVPLPYGALSVGNKDFMVGAGAQWGYNSRGSALVFTWQVWMERKPDGFGSYTPYIGTDPAPNSVVNMDTGERPWLFWSPLIDYYSGPINVGVGIVQTLGSR